jgi:hypothetical protein
MARRVTLVAAVVAVLIWGQAIPAAADTGFTSNDFKVMHAVADIGATAMVTVQGVIDRDLYATQSLFNVHPSFDLQQACQSLTDATVTITATATINWPFAQFQSTVVVPTGQEGRYLDWTVTVFYDAALDHNLSPNGICPSGYVPLGWTISCPPVCDIAWPRVTGVRLNIWPGSFLGISPLQTKKGELLWVNLTFPSGHTEY